MTHVTSEFDWDQLELEQRKTKGKLKPSDYAKLGYTENQLNLYEESFSRLTENPVKDSILKGTVTTVSGKEAILDINFIEDAYIDLTKEDKNYLHYLQEGLEVTVKVLTDPSQKGYINVSFTAAAKAMKEKEILESIGDKSVAYTGYVKDLVNGGYVVMIDDIESFMPGSLAGINKLHNFESMIGKEILVKPVNFERGNIVVSHREYLKTLIPGQIEKIKEENTTLIQGFVTGTTKYGVFCEFNECLTGMILTSDLTDEWKEMHDTGKIKPGDAIDFYVKEVVSTKKIILSQFLKYDPWSDIETRYNPLPFKATGKITSIKEYGAFIKIEEGVVGLLHQSEYENRKFTEGSEIEVSINRIDKSTKKVFLTLP